MPEYQHEDVNQLRNSLFAQSPSEVVELQTPEFVPLPESSVCVMGAKEDIVNSLDQNRSSVQNPQGRKKTVAPECFSLSSLVLSNI